MAARPARLIVALSCAVIPVTTTFAQSDEPEDAGPLPDTVVTATRTETARDELGSSISIISDEEIDRRGQYFVIEPLQFIPGVDIRQSGPAGSQTSIFLRGADSDHTLVLVDGMRLNDPSSPTGAAIADHLTVNSLARIEVLRGPQSSVWGSDAIGGVVNVVTERGEGKPESWYSIEAGSFETAIHRFQSSGGDERFDYNIGLLRFDNENISQGSAPGTGEHEDDPYRNTSFAGRFGLRAEEQGGVDLFVRHIDSDVEIDAGADPFISDTQYVQTLAKVEPYLFLFDGAWETRLGLWTHQVDRDSRGTGFALPSTREGEIYTADWQNHLRLSETHRVTFGIEHRDERAEAGAPFGAFSGATRNLAFYLQDQLQLGERVFLTLGGRADDHEEFGTHFTYRAAAAYHHLETGTILRGSAGSAFKAPSLAELFDATFGSNNRSLDAEESTGYDLGIEQELWGERLTAGATYFHNDIDEMIVSVFNPGPGTFINTNIESAVTQGVEFFTTARPIRPLILKASYTYTDTEAREAASFGITDGSRLLRRPLHKAALDITWLVAEERGSVTLSILYIGEREDLDPVAFTTVTAEDYVLVNLAAQYKLTDQVELLGRVVNLFDEDYEDVLGFETPGTSAYAGVRVTF